VPAPALTILTIKMNFKKVDFDDDLDDMEADELRDLVGQFTDAQEANIETYEEVSDAVEQFNDYDEKLTGEVVEHSSLSEDAASALPFSEKKSLLDDLDGDETDEEEFDDDGGGSGGEQEFEDRGQKGQTHGEDGTPEAVETAFDSISGVELN